MLTHMKTLLASLSPGRTPDARFDLSAAIGSTLLRQVTSSGLYFLALWVTTRQLGPHDNGLLVTALLLPQTLYAFLNLGLGPSHVYHMSSGIGSPGAMRRMNWSLALGLWTAAVLVLAPLGETLIGRYLPGTSKQTALYASLLFPMMLLASWTSSLIQGSRDYLTYNKTALTQPFVFCMGVLALGATHRVSVVSVLTCHILSQAALWLASEIRVRRYPAAAAGPGLKLGGTIAFGLRAHLSNVITFLNYRVALYLVTFLLDPTAAGRYALSIQLAEVLWLIASAASVVVFPESAAHNSTPAALQKMIRKVALSVFKVTVAMALLAAALSVVVIPWVFGRDYAASVLPFVILLPGIVTWSYMSVVSNSLAGMGCQRVNIQAALLSFGLNCGGCLLAIPVFGMHGAALASTVAFTVTAGYTVFMYRSIMAERIAEAEVPRQGHRTEGEGAMKPKRMLMITSYYPYGQSEAFVTAELEHISRFFGEIELAPIFHSPGATPRTKRYPLNIAYADKRWGVLRVLHVAVALLGALASYRWGPDLALILRRGHKLANLKELVRALYRARMFEHFLVKEARQAGGGFDVIYTYWLVPEILGAVRFRKTSGSAVRIVSRAHGGDLYEDRRAGGYAGLRREIVAGVDAIYCISDHGRRYLEQGFPALAERFHMARLGVDDPGYLNSQPRSGPLSVLSCAFVVSGKRLHLIVDAIARLLADDPALEVRWTHVGDGPLFDTVRDYAASRLGPRAQAVFKGYLTQAELMALCRDDSFDVIVNVSDSEGIPVSLMEASAVGIPMVATDVGGNAEIVNAANGVVIPADADTTTIAAAIARFNDRRAVRACRREARRHWEAHFNAAANYEQFGRSLAALPGPEPKPEPPPRAEMPGAAVARAPHDGPDGG